MTDTTRDARDARDVRDAGDPQEAESRPPLTPLEKARAAVRSRTAPPARAEALLPQEECDALASRMQHAVVGFVDGPQDAVAEADHVLEELAARFTDAVNRRRSALRGSWQPTDRQSEATAPDTEQLRLALRDYRELSERLLHV
ncbi:hypothetical protein [Streptomyces griseoruber]|uniref:Uncharacterized protein n=1 Tax=Streptomyces griseoruber TaxID=1943 RepID=A0A124I4M8_9ACTN|nr:hypothetical protein AQJ64_07585 [Streptomyces griseoruber]